MITLLYSSFLSIHVTVEPHAKVLCYLQPAMISTSWPQAIFWVSIVYFIKISCNSIKINYYIYWIIIVPHSKSGLVPRSSLSGAGQSGFWEVGKGGTIGWRVGQIGSVYKQPETEEDNSCHSWRVPSKWKRGTKGSKGNWKGKAKETAPCIYVNAICVLKNNWTLNNATTVYIQQ